MGISIKKGQRISLRKASSDSGSSSILTKIKIGLGWQARITAGASFDLDATAFMLEADGKVPNDSYFIFYSQLRSPCGSVEHMGDELEGSSTMYVDEDEEQFMTSTNADGTVNVYEDDVDDTYVDSDLIVSSTREKSRKSRSGSSLEFSEA